MQIEVCLSPALLPQYELENKIVVVTDVLRATSTMVSALEIGVTEILPVASRAEAFEFIGQTNHLVAGERDGKKVEGFDLGNSPLLLKENATQLKNKTLVITTTNGTKAINQSRVAKEIFIGALTNVQALADVLVNFDEDILVVCAGWKNRVNLEDTLFGGALCDALSHRFEIYGDAAIMSQQLYNAHKNNLFDSIKNATHYKRLKNHGIENDIKHCMSMNISSIVPVMKGDVVKQY